MKIRISVVQADSPDLLEEVYAIRHKVFVEEQGISREDEFDQYESACRHFLAYDAVSLDPMGSARWRKTAEGIKLERFSVLPEFRSCGVGSALVEAVITDIRSECAVPANLYLHAQTSALPLYLKSGFQVQGEEYLECGIPHLTMTLTIT